ncbi:hypothetical protein GEMRC1_011251 [Eukaryota sp. GEM-RC1]
MTETLSGTFEYPDGSTYVGEYIRNESNEILKHGSGLYKSNSFTFEGEFDNDLHINGTLSFSSGCVYQGQFDNGKYSGTGIMTWPSGACYSGVWFDGQPHGEGTFTSAEKTEFVGHFHKGTGPGLFHAVQ